jgi:hypothetical protein
MPHTRDHRPHHLRPTLDTVRVALVHRDFTGGAVSHVGLGITAAYTEKTLRENGIWAETWAVKSPEALAERVRRTHLTAVSRGDVRPTHVILSAPWILTDDIARMANEFPDVQFVIVSHSCVGFLSADPHAIRLLRETADLQLATHNVFVGGNSRKFTDWAREAWGVNAVCLPNLYNLTESFPRRSRWGGTALRLGLFGANRPLKNLLSAVAATVELVARLKLPTALYVSSGRTEGGSFRALDEMTEDIPLLTVHQTGWLPWPRFRRLVRTMDLVLQVSYTESFNVVTADAIAEGVPVVGSDAIEWLPEHWQARADEPRDITAVAERLLRDPSAPEDGRDALEAYVERGLVSWKRFLSPP